MFYQLFVLVLTSLLLLQACDKKKTPLVGKRENVLLSDPELRPDPHLKGEKPILGTPTPQQNWDQPGRISPVSGHVALPQNKLTQSWRTRISPPSSGTHRLTSPPVTHNGILYTLNPEGYVVAISAKNGEEIWKLDIRPQEVCESALGGGISYHQGKLYMTTPCSEIVCVDSETKKILWRKNLPMPSRAAPTIYHDRLFVLTVGNTLICVDLKTGQELWTHAGMLETAGLLGGTSVAMTDNIGIVPYTSGEVYGLHIENAEVFWTESLASFGRVDSIASLPHIHARPIIQEGVVYLVSHSGRCAALQAKTGDIIWEQNFGGSETPAVSGNSLFLITAEQVVLCLDKATGRIRWVKELQRFEDPEKAQGFIVWKGPVLAGNKLIVASSSGRMLLLDAYTGDVIQEIDLEEGACVEPIVANNSVYIVTDKGYLVSYH